MKESYESQGVELTKLKLEHQNLKDDHQNNLSTKNEFIHRHEQLQTQLEGHTNQTEKLQIQNEELNN